MKKTPETGRRILMSEQVEYTYDLFISYADADRAWVEARSRRTKQWTGWKKAEP